MSDILDQIKAGHAREAAVAASGSPLEPGALPFSYEQITPEWLSVILCRNHPEFWVTGVRLDEEDEGTAQRRRIFVEYNSIDATSSLPSSVFCKATQSVAHRFNLGISGGIHAEVTFYAKIRPLLDLDIPTAYYAKYDPNTFNSLIIMPDFAAEVEFCRHWTVINREKVESQLQLLAGLHSKFQDNPTLNASSLGMTRWPDFFEAVVSFGHEGCSKAGFLEAKDVIPPSLYKRFDEFWPSIRFVNETHKSLPATLLHGDCHLKQWYVRKGTDHMGLTDWQCSSFGFWARDVAYMLVTSLSVEDRRAWETDLLKFYLDCMHDKGAVVPDFNEAWLRYRQNVVQAMSWWTATLTPTSDQPDMQPRDTSLEFIGRFAHAVEDLDGFSACK